MIGWGLPQYRFFFVLSGFVMTLGYGKRDLSTFSQKTDFAKEFYIKRLIRLLPVYFVATILELAFAKEYIEDTDDGGLAPFILQWFALTSWIGKAPLVGPMWQISSLFFCYLAFPFVLPLLQKVQGKIQALAWAQVMFVVAALGYFLIIGYAPGEYDQAYDLARMFPVFRLPVFLIGSFYLLARKNYDEPPMGSSFVLDGLTVVMFLIIAIGIYSCAVAPDGGILGARPIVGAVLPFIHGPMAMFLSFPDKQSIWHKICMSAPLQFIGNIGLSVYAVQEVVSRYLAWAIFGYKSATFFEGGEVPIIFPWWFPPVAFCLVVFVGWIVHDLVETRFNNALLAWMLPPKAAAKSFKGELPKAKAKHVHTSSSSEPPKGHVHSSSSSEPPSMAESVADKSGDGGEASVHLLVKPPAAPQPPKPPAAPHPPPRSTREPKSTQNLSAVSLDARP